MKQRYIDREGWRFYVYTSDQFVIVTTRETDNDHLKGVTFHRGSKHVNTFQGTVKDIEDVCLEIAKEVHRGTLVPS